MLLKLIQSALGLARDCASFAPAGKLDYFSAAAAAGGKFWRARFEREAERREKGIEKEALSAKIKVQLEPKARQLLCKCERTNASALCIVMPLWARRKVAAPKIAHCTLLFVRRRRRCCCVHLQPLVFGGLAPHRLQVCGGRVLLPKALSLIRGARELRGRKRALLISRMAARPLRPMAA